jgi:tetratricopeptide (TPR) repeat protein
MTRFALLFCVLVFLSAPAHAAEDVLMKATKLLEKRHYDEAAAVLRPGVASVEQAKQGVAYLTLGTAYLRNAELHRELYQSSLTVNADYLGKLAADRGKGRSRFVDLFLGEALVAAGKHEAAAAPLEKFIAEGNTVPKYRETARVLLGVSSFLRGDKQKADEIWNGVDKSDPEVRTELAAAYSRVGLNDRNPVALCEEGLAAMKKAGKPLSLRAVKNGLAVYVKAGLTDKGLDLLKSADLKTPSYDEHVSRSKDINFYDISLLGDLVGLYFQASQASFEKAAKDPKLKDTVNFHLGEVYALTGNIDQSVKVLGSFISNVQMPQQVRDRAVARQAANHYQRGKQFESIGVWDDLSRKQPVDPDLIAEIVTVCSRLRIDCPKVVQRAEALAEAGQGKKYSSLNVAVGKYYLAKRNHAKALAYLEAGRDKGNKNKIEANDPLMLANLADVYYRTKKFSEALEIYFEMGKHFPEVRQIQDALQGIYSVEQKSAGDVKIN